jgi:hypothetical protein
MKVWNLILSLLDPALYLILINDILIDKNISLFPLVIGGYIGILSGDPLYPQNHP